LGVVSYDKAKELAAEAGEDLVLVSDRSVPPVVRIMNFGKLRYEQKKNLKQQRKSTAVQKVKEVKFRINIDQHDYETKLKHALDFLAKKFRVKVTLAMRGREMAHQDMAFDVIERVSADLAPFADADGKPKLLGRNISVNFAPKEAGKKSAAGKALTDSEDNDPQKGKDSNNA
jgi:translation initiation factor IF-3